MRMHIASPRFLRMRSMAFTSLVALLLGVSAVATVNISSARAAEPIPAPMKGKTWKASIYQLVVQVPYVSVAGVLDENKPAKISDLKWYYVLPQSNWVIDCKYYHSTMGWMYRGTQIQGITDAGGPFDGYYETGYLATILANSLRLADVDELCYPGGDAGAPTARK